MRERIRQFWKAYGPLLLAYSFGSLVGVAFIWLGIVAIRLGDALSLIVGGFVIILGVGISLGMAGKILKDYEGIFGILTIFFFIAMAGIAVAFVLWIIGVL